MPEDFAVDDRIEIPPPGDRYDAMEWVPKGRPIVLDGSQEYPAEQLGIPSSDEYNTSVIAELAIPTGDEGQPQGEGWAHIAVLRVAEKATGKVGFLLQGLTVQEDGSVTPAYRSYYDQQTGEQRSESIPPVPIPDDAGAGLVIGRRAGDGIVTSDDLWGTPPGAQTSRRHVAFTVIDGRLAMTDTSLNGTKYAQTNRPVEYSSVDGDDKDVYRDYSLAAADVARARQAMELQMGKEPRHSIGRDTPILNGVYEGAYGGEAIVVNYTDDPELIDDAVETVLRRAKDRASGNVDKGKLLDNVFAVVDERMAYDSDAVDEIFETLAGGRDHTKISLGVYIELGVGECRHQALFAGAILERLKGLGYINGQASVDRNAIRRGADGKYDGHAWVRYTNSGGEVYIIDLAQRSKIISLEDAIAAHEADPARNWDYSRLGDKERYRKAV